MGTRLIYDYQQQKWIPYVSDSDKWYQHLLDVRDGYAERDSQGHYIVGSGRKYRELKEMRQKEGLSGFEVNFGEHHSLERSFLVVCWQGWGRKVYLF